MGLFVKKEHVLPLVPLYSIGMSKTILVVGLGNPGKEYDQTRHNLGFLCVDFFVANNEFPDWVAKKDLKCHYTSTNLGDTRVIVIKPTTFMNLSGEAVQAAQHFFKVAPDQTVVVHDELDIPFGQIRVRQGGGSAGNNGLKSIIQHGGEQAWRIRIGIRSDDNEHMDSADFVLAKLGAAEQTHLKALRNEVNTILTEYIYSGQLLSETRSWL